MHGLETELPLAARGGTTRYEAPAVESVLTSHELDREVAYAGSYNQVSCTPKGYYPTNGS